MTNTREKDSESTGDLSSKSKCSGYFIICPEILLSSLFLRNQFDIVFQHHDHVYGRTKKLLGDERLDLDSKKGTVYTNSGCMGVAPMDTIEK